MMIAVSYDLDAALRSSTSAGTDKAEREQPDLERLIATASDDGRDDTAYLLKAIHALDKTNGNRTHAARMSGISVCALRSKLNQYREKMEAQ